MFNCFAILTIFGRLMEHTFLSSPVPEGAVICGREAIIILWPHRTKPSSIKLQTCCVDGDHNHA